MEVVARIHAEDGSYWAEVDQLPGCFASGSSVDELLEALREAVSLYLSEPGAKQVVVPQFTSVGYEVPEPA